MLKRIFQIILAIGLITVFLISSAGCGDKNEDTKKRTLTVSVIAMQLSTENAIRMFENKYPDVELVINDYNFDSVKYAQQISTQLIAGVGPDVFQPYGIFDTKILDNGLFADFYPIMQNDPDFNENDYYMSIVKSSEYRGKLFAFPGGFDHHSIGVNNLFSKPLAERYNVFDTISYNQLLDLYDSLPDKGGRYLGSDIDPYIAVSNNLHIFVDLESKTCDFNNDYFIKYITDLKNATDPKKETLGYRNYGLDPREFHDKSFQERYALQYLFRYEVGSRFYHSFLLPYANEQVFTHFIPLADEKGALITSLPLSAGFHCISAASDNKDLAWEYIKLFTTPEAIEGFDLQSYPIRRDVFKTRVTESLENTIELRRKIEAIDGVTSEIVGRIMAFLEHNNDMPAVPSGNIKFYGLERIIEETLADFHRDLLTAEQAASVLQNKISLYLTE